MDMLQFHSKINTLQYGYNCLFFQYQTKKLKNIPNSLNLESFTFSC